MNDLLDQVLANTTNSRVEIVSEQHDTNNQLGRRSVGPRRNDRVRLHA